MDKVKEERTKQGRCTISDDLAELFKATRIENQLRSQFGPLEASKATPANRGSPGFLICALN
ncbi:MAG: hypothetical protein HWN51_01380 [Desulfobacterales bacterium]|nr:hypothetical protein [Desulfobacterales bacterium]